MWRLTVGRAWANNPGRVSVRKETIGQRVRRLRKARGLSQKQLATKGLSYAYVSRIESGERNPSVKTMRILARQLGVSLEHLETGALVPAIAERELRLSDAELELRLDRDLEKAARVFEAELKRGDDPALDARAHAGLGLLAAHRSNNTETIRHLEAATGSGYFRPETRPDLYRTLGVAYVAIDRPRRAVELFEGCLVELRERVPDPTLQVRFAAYLAAAHSAAGNADEAQRALADATAKADDEAASPQAKINLYWALCREAWEKADTGAALAHIHRAIGLLEVTEDTYHLARAHLLCAQMLNLDRGSDEVDLHLERAERLVEIGADEFEIGVLRAEQARRAAEKDEESALAYAKEAARLLGKDARFLGLKWHALAAAYKQLGDLNQAESYFKRALEVLKRRRQHREASTVAREYALMLRSAGRDDEAFAFMDEAAMLRVRDFGRSVRARQGQEDE